MSKERTPKWSEAIELELHSVNSWCWFFCSWMLTSDMKPDCLLHKGYVHSRSEYLAVFIFQVLSSLILSQVPQISSRSATWTWLCCIEVIGLFMCCIEVIGLFREHLRCRLSRPLHQVERDRGAYSSQGGVARSRPRRTVSCRHPMDAPAGVPSRSSHAKRLVSILVSGSSSP